MASTVVQTIPYAQTPVISKETREKLAQERKRLAADPSAVSVPADLAANAKYVFRTKPNTYRQLVVTIPLPPDEANFPGEPAQYNFVKRRWARLVGGPGLTGDARDKAAAEKKAQLEAVRDALNDDRIVFIRIKRSVECYYPTDNPVVAEYLRSLMLAGKEPFDKVYEVSGLTRLVVGDTAFPNTELGRKLAFAHMAEFGGDLKIVTEE
jgi:hypothetical protein